MDADRPLIFGPAYLDLVVDVACPLLAPAGGAGAVRLLDQSLPAARRMPRQDDTLVVIGPSGDRLTCALPPALAASAATYTLCEPVLARLCGANTDRVVVADYPVAGAARQLGGMGAGYARALGGLLRAPFGDDAIARDVLALLAAHAVDVTPAWLPGCESDASLLLQSAWGDKLAIGVRQAMTRWTAAPEDGALAARASALVFCGAPNALVETVLRQAPAIPVMCAPALRNVRDRAVPLADLAPRVHYLTLNALEWAHLEDADRVRGAVPVITVTAGANGSRIFLRDEEIVISAVPFDGAADANRAGETYGATFFRALRAACPDFPRGAVPRAVAEQAGHLAARQAARQLALRGFAFPPDDGM